MLLLILSFLIRMQLSFKFFSFYYTNTTGVAIEGNQNFTTLKLLFKDTDFKLFFKKQDSEGTLHTHTQPLSCLRDSERKINFRKGALANYLKNLHLAQIC